MAPVAVAVAVGVAVGVVVVVAVVVVVVVGVGVGVGVGVAVVVVVGVGVGVAVGVDLINNRNMFDTSKVTRVEVIDFTKPMEDGGGRCYTFWSEYDTADKKDPIVEVHLQDDGRTLKVFIR